jgi:hypothetical protein
MDYREDDWDDDVDWDYGSRRMYMNASSLGAQAVKSRTRASSPKRKASPKRTKKGSSWEAFKNWWTTPVSKSSTKKTRKRLTASELQAQPLLTPLAMEPIVTPLRGHKRHLNPVPLEPFSLVSASWQDWFRGTPAKPKRAAKKKPAQKKKMGAAETRPMTPNFGERTVNAGMKKRSPRKKKPVAKRSSGRKFGRKL